MYFKVNLPPNVEQAYLAEAQSRGLSLDDVVAETLIAARKPAARAASLSRRRSSFSTGYNS